MAKEAPHSRLFANLRNFHDGTCQPPDQDFPIVRSVETTNDNETTLADSSDVSPASKAVLEATVKKCVFVED